MTDQVDIAIIGGGAAGLASAIFAAEAAPPGTRITVLDGAKNLGAKILVSGGGRCNVTHRVVRPEDFNGPRTIVRNVLAAFGEKATIRWFASLGVELKQEPTGKLFPVTDSARTVLNALLRRCDELRVSLRANSRVTDVALQGEASSPFTVVHSGGAMQAARVIACAGGRSLPRSGSDGSGWEMLRRLGHTVTPTYAALVPLTLVPDFFHAALSGIAQEVELSVLAGAKRVDRRTGSMLWTHFGVSGPVVMDASRFWTSAYETGQEPRVLCNLLPGQTFETLERSLIDAASTRPKAPTLSLFTGELPERVAAAALRHAGADPSAPVGQLPREIRRALVHAITALPLPVTGHRGWNYAEVTAGGVPLTEVDFRTMGSRKVPGLHLAGEILDCDGRIGGFNFQWAWSTGHLAGRAAARSLEQRAWNRASARTRCHPEGA